MSLDQKAQERTIGGIVYRSWPIPAGVGVPALVRLIKIMAPILAAVYRELPTRMPTRPAPAPEGDAPALNVGVLVGVFEALPIAFTDADVIYFAELFGSASKYQNPDDPDKWPALVAINRDTHFAARYFEFVRWILFNMEVNFSGFFAGMSDGKSSMSALIAMVNPSK